MSSTYDVNGNKVSMRDYLEFRLSSIDKILDALRNQVDMIQNWQSRDEGKGSGSSMTVMYLIIIVNLALTAYSLAQKYIN